VNTPNGNRTRRCGVALLWAVVILAVLGVMMATAAWQFAAARRGLAARHNRLQAQWLARSGCELAAARLLADPADYAGEVVEPVPDGQVRITVEKDKADTFRVRCEARYPVGDNAAAMLTVRRTATRRGDGDNARIELAVPDNPGDEAKAP